MNCKNQFSSHRPISDMSNFSNFSFRITVIYTAFFLINGSNGMLLLQFLKNGNAHLIQPSGMISDNVCLHKL